MIAQIPVLENITLLIALSNDESIVYSFVNIIEVTYIEITGYLDAFHILNYGELFEKSRNYKSVLETFEFTSSIFYIHLDNGDVQSFYSKFEATTKSCHIKTDIYKETGLNDFKFNLGWNSLNMSIPPVTCS
jgi:hypothetical protein